MLANNAATVDHRSAVRVRPPGNEGDVADSARLFGNLSYGWDANKNKTGETIGGTMANYGFSIPGNGYDAEDRLVAYNRASGLDQSWSLSLVGDWNSVTTNGTPQSRTHGAGHELTVAGGQNVSTDVKGNITLIPAAVRPNASALAVTWDFDNRMANADVGNDSSVDVTYKFDALGRRIYRDDGTTTVFVPSGQQTVADYVAGAAPGSALYRYIYASYIDEPVLRYQVSGAVSLYYHRNQQYSVTALTNSGGTIVERYAYTAYGVPTIADGSGSPVSASAYNNRYTYTGREWDPTIFQYHYRARTYDASLGRFCGRDPIGYIDGKSLYYSYFGQSGTDPSGEQCCLYVWNQDGGNVGHASLECSGKYMSFWPADDAGLFYDGPCTSHTYHQDIAAEGGREDSKTCIPFPIDEQKILDCWNKIVNDCNASNRNFKTLGNNCSTTVTELLKCSVPPCEDTCASCEYLWGCKDSCGGELNRGCPGIDRPETAKQYTECFKKNRGNTQVPVCVPKDFYTFGG